ncbi:hypothetical protein ACYSNX_12855, partial [Myroides sp. LJL115]
KEILATKMYFHEVVFSYPNKGLHCLGSFRIPSYPFQGSYQYILIFSAFLPSLGNIHLLLI